MQLFIFQKVICKHPNKYICQLLEVRDNFVSLIQTENMLTREQIEEIQTESREKGILVYVQI